MLSRGADTLTDACILTLSLLGAALSTYYALQPLVQKQQRERAPDSAAASFQIKNDEELPHAVDVSQNVAPQASNKPTDKNETSVVSSQRSFIDASATCNLIESMEKNMACYKPIAEGYRHDTTAEKTKLCETPLFITKIPSAWGLVESTISYPHANFVFMPLNVLLSNPPVIAVSVGDVGCHGSTPAQAIDAALLSAGIQKRQTSMAHESCQPIVYVSSQQVNFTTQSKGGTPRAQGKETHDPNKFIETHVFVVVTGSLVWSFQLAVCLEMPPGQTKKQKKDALQEIYSIFDCFVALAKLNPQVVDAWGPNYKPSSSTCCGAPVEIVICNMSGACEAHLPMPRYAFVQDTSFVDARLAAVEQSAAPRAEDESPQRPRRLYCPLQLLDDECTATYTVVPSSLNEPDECINTAFLNVPLYALQRVPPSVNSAADGYEQRLSITDSVEEFARAYAHRLKQRWNMNADRNNIGMKTVMRDQLSAHGAQSARDFFGKCVAEDLLHHPSCTQPLPLGLIGVSLGSSVSELSMLALAAVAPPRLWARDTVPIMVAWTMGGECSDVWPRLREYMEKNVTAFRMPCDMTENMSIDQQSFQLLNRLFSPLSTAAVHASVPGGCVVELVLSTKKQVELISGQKDSTSIRLLLPLHVMGGRGLFQGHAFGSTAGSLRPFPSTTTSINSAEMALYSNDTGPMSREVVPASCPDILPLRTKGQAGLRAEPLIEIWIEKDGRSARELIEQIEIDARTHQHSTLHKDGNDIIIKYNSNISADNSRENGEERSQKQISSVSPSTLPASTQQKVSSGRKRGIIVHGEDFVDPETGTKLVAAITLMLNVAQSVDLTAARKALRLLTLYPLHRSPAS